MRSRPALIVAVAAFLLVLAWQSATVAFNYSGDWTGLFHVGGPWRLPPELASERVRVFGDAGYDGLFYHLVAHDPWLVRGFANYADNPSLRWRRILIPGLAHIAALGRDRWIHAGFVGVNLLLIFAGTYWLARYCASNKLSAARGLAFLSIPSVLVSIDRLTIDTALAALTVGFILYAVEGRNRTSLALLALCPLARETGLALTAGRTWQHWHNREWKQLLLAIGSVIPFLAWFTYVFHSTPRDGTPWFSFPFAGIIRRTINPIQYAITGRWVALAAAFDYLALAGIWIALALALRLALRRRFGLIESCIYSFALGAVWLGKADIWAGAYEFGRTMSPLIILLGMLAIRERDRLLLLPLVCTLPRVLLQFEPQLRGIVRHFAS